MGAEVRNDVKTLFFTEDSSKDRVGKVERIGTVFRRNHKSVSRTQVTRQLGKAIFIKVNYHQFCGPKTENFLDKRRTD